MLIYYIILCSTFMYGIFEMNNDNSLIRYSCFGINIDNMLYSQTVKKRKIITILLFLQLGFISSFRNFTIGVDLKGYISNYFNPSINSSLSNIFKEHWNNGIGYFLLNWLIGQFTNNFQFIIVITSIISISLFLHLFYKESKIIWLSVFIFICFIGFGQLFSMLKQILAMSIIAYGYKYIKKQNFKKYLLCVILAVSFHTTAIVCIFIYFFSHHKLNFLNYIKYIFIGLITIIGSTFFINLFIKYYRGGMYAEYIIGGKGYTWLLVLIGILFVGLFFKNSAVLSDKNNIIVYNITILSIILQLISLNFSIFVRVVYYYSFFLSIFIPNIIYSLKNKYLRLFGIGITVVICFAFFMKGLNENIFEIVPFSFFWERSTAI